ncbi:MAG: hypothetical protein QM497_01480 [Sulfurimonas sp.]
MKYLAWLMGLLVSLVIVVYVVAFTSFGNNLLKPTIESKIREQTKLDSKLKTFKLSMSKFEILLELNKNNTILVAGNYSIFSQAFNIAYRMSLEELKTLKPLTQTQLNSSFHTDGKVVGDMAFLKVDGKSDVAKSATTYHVELTDLNPTSIIAKIDAADLSKLLFMLNQKAYASADINLDINFKNITPHQLDGTVNLKTLKGKLNSKVMKKDFNISIPHTAFTMNLDANLKGDDVDYTYALNSNLAKLTSSGNLSPEPLAIDIKYGLNVKELAVLKPITGADVRGALKLKGTVKGNKKKMNIIGKSDFASSDTTFLALLENFQPSKVKVKIKHLKLQRALYMVKQPHYADALFSMDIDILDARTASLKGIVKSKITNGLVDSTYMTKAYEFKTKMPRTTFNANTTTTLNKNIVDTKVDFNSNLADFDIKSAKFNIKDSSIVSDYIVKIPNLDKLYFASDRHIKGGIIAKGELKKAKDLDFTMHSDIAGGKVDALLHNDDFHATLASLQTLDIFDMLIYPKIIKSSIDGKLDYNLVKQSGIFDGKLSDGKFTKNQVLDITQKYAHIDLYKQVFKGDVDAKIMQEHILASLNLKSNTSSIITKNTKLNSKTQAIDSKIEINANGNPITVTLRGNVNRPKVGINAEKLMKKEATKAVKKEINKLFKKFF